MEQENKAYTELIGAIIQAYISDMPVREICKKYSVSDGEIDWIIQNYYVGTMHVKQPEMYLTIKSKV